ncbi:hypothetical protein B0T12DRAFT_396089 [Alternaria alternata]|jgi:hypothetical protein|nr:hypothetical protein B0T12DRAFT_396089 [Alternaria alternata]
MSSPHSFDILRLAPELVANVIKQVDNKKDLSHVRLACKALDDHAAKELFKEVYISPSEGHIRSWNTISQDDVIRRMPRHAIIHTHPDIEDLGLGHTREPIEVDEDDEDALVFDDALAALSRFPNLDSLEIGFTPECMGRDADYWQEVEEDVSDREERLTLIFQAIKDRAADDNNRTIRKLTIINLQNCPIPEFTSSDLFRDVMAQLEELHITMVQEYNEHGPDHDYTKVELQIFPAYFCSHWLKPVAANLKALSIYSASDNWGPFPGYFDPSGISFPKLETLALGYYTLAHDDDLNWILAIKSLRRLIFHNCMIASWIRIDSDNMDQWKVRTQDWTRLSDPKDHDWDKDFAYGGRWSQFLDRIARDLTNLIDFRFGYGNSYEDPKYKVTNRDSCPTEVFFQRYICFDNGILPTHWPEPRQDDGVLYSWLKEGFPVNAHKENFDEDQKSLDALLQTLQSRIEGN